MWTIIALAICLTWAVILKAQGHAWSTVIMRPLIGLGALMLATVFHAIAFVALRVNAPSRLTERSHHAKRGRRLLLRYEEGGGLFS